MEQKTSPIINYRNRTLVGKMNFKATLLRAWLVSIVILLVVGVILLLCGAFYGANKALLISGVICVTISIPLMLFYIGVTRCRRQSVQSWKHPTNGQISTVCPPEYYAQTPPGLKTDYPMGPLLIMTLPRPKENRSRRSSGNQDDSMSSTPSMSCQRKLAKGHKNVPPLASAETLTPSLISSSTGFDSVI